MHIVERLNEGSRFQSMYKDENENETKTKNKILTPDKRNMTSANHTPGGYRFVPLEANQLWRENQPENACFGLSYPSLALPVTLRHSTACRSPALALSVSIYFAMRRSALSSTALRQSRSSWAAVVHRSALIPKALRSSRKHSIHSLNHSRADH